MSFELITILTAASPIVELRGAIPLALGVFGFSPFKAYVLSVIGNLLPIIPWYFFLNYMSGWLMARNEYARRALARIFERAARLHRGKFEAHLTHFESSHSLWREVLLAFALFVFVAIPAPGTGAWTGVLVAFLLRFPAKVAIAATAAGVFAAGALVLALAWGAFAVI